MWVVLRTAVGARLSHAGACEGRSAPGSAARRGAEGAATVAARVPGCQTTIRPLLISWDFVVRHDIMILPRHGRVKAGHLVWWPVAKIRPNQSLCFA